MNAIQDYVINLINSGKKNSTSGWISFNAVCCHHRGESSDKRHRGGLLLDTNGNITYNCFNCNYTASYIAGKPIFYKFRKLLSWFGVAELEIQRLVIEAWKIQSSESHSAIPIHEETVFDAKSIPREAQSLLAWAEFYILSDKIFPKEFVDCVNYLSERKINLQKYNFYWTPEVENKLSHRVIIPFIYKNKTVGYTARAINDGIKPKYHSDYPSNIVFNLDNQKKDSKFVILSEGPFDAMSVDGISVQTNDISEQQANLIDSLGREVIVVPDFDKHMNKSGKVVWPGQQLILRAMEFGYSVSFPVWKDQCKDINEAVCKFGKLFVLKSIIQGKESNSLKIKLLSKIL